MKVNKYVKLIIAILLPFVAGAIGSFFTRPAISSWYFDLNKPSLNPPNWIFGPAWTFLYILMGISLFLVWMSLKNDKRSAFWFFGIQLFLNTTWSISFFGLQNPLLGLINIAILWFFIFLTIIFFFRISKTAGLLLVPYILWVSFASYLNYTILILN